MPTTALPQVTVDSGQPFLSAAIPSPQGLFKLTLDGTLWAANARLRARLLIAEDGLTFKEVASMGGVPADLFNNSCSIGVDFGTLNAQRACKVAVDVTLGSIQLVATLANDISQVVVPP